MPKPRGRGVWVPAFAGTTCGEDLLLALRLVPQRVHFGERSALKGTPLRRQCALDMAEAAFEFGVGTAQRKVRISADMPRQIDQRKQEIAGFRCEFIGVAAVEGGFDLVGFLANR